MIWWTNNSKQIRASAGKHARNQLQSAFDWLVNCTRFCTPSTEWLQFNLIYFLRLLGLTIKMDWKFLKVLFEMTVAQQFITPGSSWIERVRRTCWVIIGNKTAGSLLLPTSSKPISGFVSEQNHDRDGTEALFGNTWSQSILSRTWSSVAGYIKNTQRKIGGLRLKIAFLF